MLGGLAGCRRELSGSRNVLLFGCGTAWHAALIGRSLLEELAQISVETETAGELRFRNPSVGRRTLAIAVSQSGETADTLGALRQMKARGALTLGVVNVVGSSLARETDAGVYLHVGPEISVASTKAFTAQVAALAMLAIWLADERRRLDSEPLNALVAELLQIPDKLQRVLELEPGIRELAQRLADWEHWIFLGRGLSYPVALEGALKLKETSYIHAEGFPAAEMKHGPLALIEAGMPVVVVVPRDRTYAKMLATIEEVKSRGAQVIAIADGSDRQLVRLAEHLLVVPKTLPLLSPLLSVVPLQLLAYHTALARGCDVDRPRHLAKCVTVD